MVRKEKNLLPFTYTRPVAEIRCGILTITEKWEHFLSVKPSWLTQEYLQKKYPVKVTGQNIIINGAVFPNTELIAVIKSLKPKQNPEKGCKYNRLA